MHQCPPSWRSPAWTLGKYCMFMFMLRKPSRKVCACSLPAPLSLRQDRFGRCPIIIICISPPPFLSLLSLTSALFGLNAATPLIPFPAPAGQHPSPRRHQHPPLGGPFHSEEPVPQVHRKGQSQFLKFIENFRVSSSSSSKISESVPQAHRKSQQESGRSRVFHPGEC